MRHVRNIMVCAPVAGGCIFLYNLMHSHLAPGSQFVVFSALYMTVSASALLLYKGHEPLDPFAPIIPSFALLYLYSSASALNAINTGMTGHFEPVDGDVMRLFYISCLAGLIGMSAGFVFGKGTRIGIHIPWRISERLSEKRVFSKLVWLAPLLGIACLPWVRTAFDFVHVESYAVTALAGRVEKMQMGAGQPLREVFLCKIPLGLLLMLGLMLIFRSRSMFARLAGAAILSAHIATALLGGQRSALAAVGTLILIFINYRIRRISLATLAVVFVLGFLMTGVVSLVRSTNRPVEMISIVSKSIASGNTAFLRLDNSGEFLVGQNLMRLITGIRDGETSYTYGSSVVSELLVFIPRALYKDRPLPLSERFVDVFYPGVREAGGGYGFFYLMEGYWALGILGIPLFMMLYACVVQWVYKGFISTEMTDGMAMWYGFVVYALVFAAVRSGVVGVFKTALMNSLALFLLCLVPSIRLKPIKSRGADT